MAVLREILTRWTLPSGGSHLTVMYFESGIAVASQRTALGALMNNWASQVVPSVSYSIDNAGREIDDTTGTLTGSWSSGTTTTAPGTLGTNPVADATQVLIRWKTATIVNGRFLKGRSYVPGLSSAQLVGGNLSSASKAVFQTGANNFISSGAGLVVWHRPGPAGPGSHDAVSTADVWSELAVLRRRRG